MLRETIKSAQITSMKAGDKQRTGALRLILAKIKDRDIELRTAASQPDDDVLVTEVLQKMAKQRKESITMFEEGGRTDRAEDEKAELAIIDEFLPKQMSEEDTRAAIEEAKAKVGADSIKDMGKVMGELKGRYGAELDMGKASALVKASFG